MSYYEIDGVCILANNEDEAELLVGITAKNEEDGLTIKNSLRSVERVLEVADGR